MGDVDLEKVARRTPGFTGADLQNLMNESAILAARRDLKEISKEEIADALERIQAGPEKKGAVISFEKKKLVAYHEAGHAVVGALMPEYDPVAKITIIPRGGAGGLTFFTPSEERLESACTAARTWRTSWRWRWAAAWRRKSSSVRSASRPGRL